MRQQSPCAASKMMAARYGDALRGIAPMALTRAALSASCALGRTYCRSIFSGVARNIQVYFFLHLKKVFSISIYYY